MIRLENVSLNLDGKQILDNVSLQIKKGDIGVVLGPSGAGKSSILKMILGLWKPDSGCVKIDGVDICNLKEKELLKMRRKMGIVFQGNALFDSLTVRQNIGYFLYEQNEMTSKEIADLIEEVLIFINMPGIQKMYPEQLSGGMKKRVAIARAMIYQPEIILYDEPSAGLDPINAKSILDLIKKVRDKGATSVVVTHIMNDAISIGDQLTLVNNGVIIENGSVHEILSSTNKFVKDFFYEVFQDAELLKKEHLV